MRQVGDVRLILAHCGGWKNWEDVPALAAFPSLMLDTSFSLGGFPDADGHYTEEERRLLSPEAFTELVRAFGADRVLFGSDSPWTDQKQSLDAFRALPLTDAEQAAVLGGNAADLLGI